MLVQGLHPACITDQSQGRTGRVRQDGSTGLGELVQSNRLGDPQWLQAMRHGIVPQGTRSASPIRDHNLNGVQGARRYGWATRPTVNIVLPDKAWPNRKG
jgi:hypothetical protein